MDPCPLSNMNLSHRRTGRVDEDAIAVNDSFMAQRKREVLIDPGERAVHVADATARDDASLSAQGVPHIFAQFVSDHLPDVLNHQKPDGSIEYDPSAPNVYPQQAIMPLAFCWAGLDPIGRWKRNEQVADVIRRLGDYLVHWYDDAGQITYHSHGHTVSGVDQRLTYAWTEALRMLRDAGGDFAFDRWADKIVRACGTLIEHRLRKLQGVRRFVARVTGTGTNHVCLYLTTVYRAGAVLGKPELCDFALPIARAFAADVHPDGYWDEHSDLMRSGGPTPAYNYLTLGGMSLMAEWTGETVFREAVERSAHFHSHLCYPDGVFLDLIDERVRCDPPRGSIIMYDSPRIWGLHAMSGTPEGRGSVLRHVQTWLAGRPSSALMSPEGMARFVENYLYWHAGPIAAPPTDRRDHQATLTLPAGIFRSGSWAMGLSCIRSYSTEDDAYRDNPFTLDRQKLFSVWHEKAGLIIDGSHSKFQPENSTFAAARDQARDFYPVGGTISAGNSEFVAAAAYKTFLGTVRLRPIDDRTLRIYLAIDPAATRGPFTAAFTLRVLDQQITGLNGVVVGLRDASFEMTGAQLGGGFTLGGATITGPGDFVLNWPMEPFNSYTSDHKSKPDAFVPRVSIALTPAKPSVEFTLAINDTGERADRT